MELFDYQILWFIE